MITALKFVHNPFRDWWIDMGIKQSFTSVAYPQANDHVEVTNRDIVDGIKARLGKRRQEWVDELPHVLWAHWKTPKESTNETPFILVYGTEAVISAEAEKKQKIANQYNKKVKPLDFQLNDLVLRSNEASRQQDVGKLGPRWEGPYEVIAVNDYDGYYLETLDGILLWRP
ncbi:uncharacterized protein [Rutidosis leptorrhynchoides]|uniref:uncharacterized protein n=1 Tax=Rutidosis leptorrhynchoides TaxID=125765 RepID=UPI003A99488A